MEILKDKELNKIDKKNSQEGENFINFIFSFDNNKSKYSTNLEEVTRCIKVFDKLAINEEKEIFKIFHSNIKEHLKKKWLEEEKDPIRFFSCLDPINQQLVASHYGVCKSKYIEIFRVHNFFKTINCSYYESEEENIFGKDVHIPYKRDHALDFYHKLENNVQRNQLIAWANNQNKDLMLL